MDGDGDLVLFAIRTRQSAHDVAQVIAEMHCFADVQGFVGIRAQDKSGGVPVILVANKCEGGGGRSGQLEAYQ